MDSDVYLAVYYLDKLVEMKERYLETLSDEKDEEYSSEQGRFIEAFDRFVEWLERQT